MDKDRVVFNYSHQGTARPVRKRPRTDRDRIDFEPHSRSGDRRPNDIPQPPPPPVLSRHYSSDSNSSGRGGSPRLSPSSMTRRIPNPPPPPTISQGRSGSLGRSALAEDPRFIVRSSGSNHHDWDRRQNHVQKPSNTNTSNSEPKIFRIPRPNIPLTPNLFIREFNDDDDDDDAKSVDTAVTRPVIRKTSSSNSQKSSKEKSAPIKVPLPTSIGLEDLTDDEDDNATVGTLATTNVTPSTSAKHFMRAGPLQTPQMPQQTKISMSAPRKRSLSGESTTSTVFVAQSKPKTVSQPPKQLLKKILNKVMCNDVNGAGAASSSGSENKIKDLIKNTLKTIELRQSVPAKNSLTVATKPGTLELVNISHNHVELHWPAPTSDGGTPIERYIIEKKDKNSSHWEKAAETMGPICKAVVKGLLENQQYQFRAIAFNKVGSSQPSVPTDPVITKPKYLAPKITNRPPDTVIELSANAIMKFDVNFIGEPPPSVLWHFNERPLESRTTPVEIENSDNNSKLAIRPVHRGDSGCYKIVVTNSSGTDSMSINVLVTDKPGKPEGLLEVTDVYKNGCKLKWEKPTDDGGCLIHYKIEELETDTDLWTLVGTSTETTIDVTGLTEKSEYKFRVRAVNKKGESEALTTEISILAKDPVCKPGKTMHLKVTDYDKDHVDLTWTPPIDDGGDPISGYLIESRKGQDGTWEKVLKVTGNETKATVECLIEGQSYEFRVRAMNKAGSGEESDFIGPIIAKLKNVAPKIDRTNLVHVKIKAGQDFNFDVVLTGEPPPDVNWTLQGKEVIPSENVELHKEDYLTKLVVKNTTRANTGTYKITATNTNGIDEAEVNVFVLDKPLSPNGPLKVSKVHANGCKLNWQASNDDPFYTDKYVVEKMDEATGCWTPAGETNSATVTSLTVDGLRPGSKYLFRVRSVNQQGKSEPLITAQAIEAKNPICKPKKPKHLKIVNFGKDFAEMTWSIPDEDGNSPITAYIIEGRDKLNPNWDTRAEVEGLLTQGKVVDLIEGNAYEFHVRAVNKAGKGEASESVECTTKTSTELNNMEVTVSNETIANDSQSTSLPLMEISSSTECSTATVESDKEKSQPINESLTTASSEISAISVPASASSSNSDRRDYPVLRIPETSDTEIERPMVSIRKDVFESGSSDEEESSKNLQATVLDRVESEIKSLKANLFGTLCTKFQELQRVVDDSSDANSSGNLVLSEQFKKMLGICTEQCEILDNAQIKLYLLEKEGQPTTPRPSEDVLMTITIDQVADYLKSLVLIDSTPSEPESSKTCSIDALGFIAHRILRILHFHYNEKQKRGREEGVAICSVDVISKACDGEASWTNEHVVRAWDKVRLFKTELVNDDVYKRAIILDHVKIGPLGFLKKVRSMVKSRIEKFHRQPMSSPSLSTSAPVARTTTPINSNAINSAIYARLSPVTPPSSEITTTIHHMPSQMTVRAPMVYHTGQQQQQASRIQSMQCFPRSVEHTMTMGGRGGMTNSIVGASSNSIHQQGVQANPQLPGFASLQQQQQQYFIPNRQQNYPPTSLTQQQFQQQGPSQAGCSGQVQRNLSEPVLRSQAQLQNHARSLQQSHLPQGVWPRQLQQQQVAQQHGQHLPISSSGLHQQNLPMQIQVPSQSTRVSVHGQRSHHSTGHPRVPSSLGTVHQDPPHFHTAGTLRRRLAQSHLGQNPSLATITPASSETPAEDLLYSILDEN